MTSERKPPQSQPLAGIRIIEISSFVAAPLCGMTLSQLGAEVIRVDPINGAADYGRWPITDDGASIYWAGLNKGKQSVAADLRSEAGQQLVQRLITEGGPGGAVVLTNTAGRDWLSYDKLAQLRPDLIHMQVLGKADGSAAVDYTVNAATGFPAVTGPANVSDPINHALPAWDVACGLYAALSITAAVRHRETTGDGAQITLPLEDVALATAGNLSFLSEVQLNGTRRQRVGNSVYGTYGDSFTSVDGAVFMIVALTPRHFRNLADVTGTTDTVAALEKALNTDFTVDGERYRHRATLTGLFGVWFAQHTADHISSALADTAVLHERFRTFTEVVASEALTSNPMFNRLEQPGIGGYLAPGLPMSYGGTHVPALAAPTLGDDTETVLRTLGLDPLHIDDLVRRNIVATAHSKGTFK